MTKRVRIENADASAHRIVVEQWFPGTTEEDVVIPDRLVSKTILANPADMTEFHVHQGMYLRVREANQDE